MLLGAIADDLTGATDLALSLAREGMRTVQVVGIPEVTTDFGGADAVVVSLKSRTVSAADAVSWSLECARLLLDAGAHQLFFKYCSTFDSTDSGNIGPVAEALLRFVGAPMTLACPAFPANNRTVYNGYLFVGGRLISESSMKDHPLTPMRDPDLVRVLARQTPMKVGLVPYGIVADGASAIERAFTSATEEGANIVIVDALSDENLREIGRAARNFKLITGGSGIAIGLPANFRDSGLLTPSVADRVSAPPGRRVTLAGSCSAATRRQIAVAAAAGAPTLAVDAFEVASGAISAARVAEWVVEQDSVVPLVYSSADPAAVAEVQKELGRERSGELIENLLGETAVLLAEQGFSQFVVAGGETSGAVIKQLGVKVLRIGQEIDPGVPWTLSIGHDPELALALKSGNFGGDDFFVRAWSMIS